jgi:hypothetical protein
MPGKTTYEAIGQSSERLLHHVMDNQELCQRFMGFVALCGLECEKRAVPMDGIQIGPVHMGGNKMTAKVSFSQLSLMRSAPPETKAADSFLAFLGKEAEGLYLLIRKNPDFIKYLQSIVEEMDGFAKWHRKEFESLKFANGYMDKEDNIVLEIEA